MEIEKDLMDGVREWIGIIYQTDNSVENYVPRTEKKIGAESQLLIVPFGALKPLVREDIGRYK